MPRIASPAVAAVMTLLFASSAGATTLKLPDGTERPQPYQRWADAALVPTIDGAVTLDLGGCGELTACAPVGERAISMAADWSSPHVLLHELGHVFDDTMPDWARQRFMAVMRKRGPWASPTSAAPADEQFAEGYSLCARHAVIRDRYAGGYMYSPTPAQHQQVCAVIKQAAGGTR
jgi:hypothetical protein